MDLVHHKYRLVCKCLNHSDCTLWLPYLQRPPSRKVSDQEALPIIFDLHSEEGLLLGGSSAINVAGAIHLAKHLGPGKTIVTILCDSGSRYFTKLWNPEFLKEKNLPIPSWLSD